MGLEASYRNISDGNLKKLKSVYGIEDTCPVKTLQLKIIKEQEICLMCVRIAISASVKANTETKLIHGCPGIKA